MRAFKKRVGDVYLNPVFGDLWILYKGTTFDDKEVWILKLVNHDVEEEFKHIVGFKKLGNIYDMCEKELQKLGWFKNE